MSDYPLPAARHVVDLMHVEAGEYPDAFGDVECRAESVDGFLCTRPPHDDGPHVARYADVHTDAPNQVACVWRDTDLPPVTELAELEAQVTVNGVRYLGRLEFVSDGSEPSEPAEELQKPTEGNAEADGGARVPVSISRDEFVAVLEATNVAYYESVDVSGCFPFLERAARLLEFGDLNEWGAAQSTKDCS